MDTLDPKFDTKISNGHSYGETTLYVEDCSTIPNVRRIALIYHFYEVSNEHSLNLEYFLKAGLSKEIDYYFMLASEPSINFPTEDNISVNKIPNRNRDIGGYISGYNLIKDKPYDYIFFINSGTGGPYLSEERTLPWYQYFLEKLNEDTKLIGTSINDLPRPIWWSSELETVLSTSPYKDYIDQDFAYHVQTGFFCISDDALQYLRAIGFFDQEFNGDYFSLVGNFEITLSQLLLHRTEEKAWNITSIQDEFLGVDFRRKVDLKIGDPYWGFEYFGRRLDPYEFIFLKTARGDLSSTELAELRTISTETSQIGQPITSTTLKNDLHYKNELEQKG